MATQAENDGLKQEVGKLKGELSSMQEKQIAEAEAKLRAETEQADMRQQVCSRVVLFCNFLASCFALQSPKGSGPNDSSRG